MEQWMNAYVHVNDRYEVRRVKRPSIGRHDVLIEMKAAGLNRRDLYINDRRYGEEEPLVLGSDGAGVIVACGEGVTRFKKGDAVLVNPSLRWFEQSAYPPAEHDILGMPDDGTFASYLAIHEEQVEAAIDHLSWEENAAIALAGMTGYRAIVTKGQVTEQDTVLIPGASSGVATFMVQYAKSRGARVIVTTRSEKKAEALRALGVDRVVSTTDDWKKELAEETITLIVDSVGSATFHRSMDVLAKGGRLVTFGSSTEDEVSFDVRQFFYAQQSIYGSTMGCREELRAVLDEVRSRNVTPVIDRIVPFEQIEEAFETLENSTQVGKVIIRLPNR